MVASAASSGAKGTSGAPRQFKPSSKFRSIKHHSSAKFAEAWEQAILETSLRCGHLQDSAFSTTKELLRAKGWRIWLKKEPWNPGWEWVTVSEFKLKYRAWRTAIHRRVDLDLAGSNSDASSSSDWCRMRDFFSGALAWLSCPLLWGHWCTDNLLLRHIATICNNVYLLSYEFVIFCMCPRRNL